MYFTYIIYSPSTDTFYKGATSDIEDRMRRHNAGAEKATKHGAPWTLLWYTKKESKSEAMKLERKLKNLSRENTIKLMMKYQQEVAGPDELLCIKQLSGC